MVDAHAVDQAFRIEAKCERMDILESLVIFHAKPGQLIDVEKAPPVDFVIRDAPIGEAIILVLQQLAKAPPALVRSRIECSQTQPFNFVAMPIRNRKHVREVVGVKSIAGAA